MHIHILCFVFATGWCVMYTSGERGFNGNFIDISDDFFEEDRKRMEKFIDKTYVHNIYSLFSVVHELNNKCDCHCLLYLVAWKYRKKIIVCSRFKNMHKYVNSIFFVFLPLCSALLSAAFAIFLFNKFDMNDNKDVKWAVE